MKPTEALRLARIDTIVNGLPEVLHSRIESRGINETITGVTFRPHYDAGRGRTGDLSVVDSNDPDSVGDVVPFWKADAFEAEGAPDRDALVYGYGYRGIDCDPMTIKRIAGNVLRAGYRETFLARWRRAASYLLRDPDF